MAIAATVRHYLDQLSIDYEVVEHPRTLSSSRTAEAGHISGERLAKAVVLKSEAGYTMAVLQASCHVRLGEMQGFLARPVGLATEREVGQLFEDCELGAVPPMGQAYGIEMIVDDDLVEQPDIYFEAGDHERLIHMKAMEFRRLTAAARHGRFSRHD
jgi:Ala-tRNA(Pro) deacylase